MRSRPWFSRTRQRQPSRTARREGAVRSWLERDLYFAARFSLSVYAEAARLAGHTTEDEQLLRQAAAALSIPIPELPPDTAE
ncbi:DUF2958 domain-containing protein [Mesorhizobium sp. M8A.F.Ca.ET.182.01.1.1]|uniref:DUF2958 domain-containing protein n=1 Tax=Mesorhizobium sp. M8A.F.Ca.ET.181.01.1.1 TaxID=2563963 RepID=UPI003006F0CE